MIKEILLFTSVICATLSTYRPMTMKTIDFGENICKYTDNDSGDSTNLYIEYVKPCQEGKICTQTLITNNNYKLHTCEPLPKSRKTIGESCKTDFECDKNLKCSSDDKCTIQDSNMYSVDDSASNLKSFYCSSDKQPFYSGKPDFNEEGDDYPTPSCINTFPGSTVIADYNNKFYVNKNNANKFVGLQHYKVPGKINFKTKQANSDYEVDSIDLADIGSLEAGTPVFDERACESGFTLYFYGNGLLTKPDVPDGTTPTMYRYCANLKEVLAGYFVYTLSDGTEKIYNMGQISDTKYSYNLKYDPITIQTKLEMFKNYLNALKPKLETCKSDYDYTEPYTCKDDEIRKWWYFYNNPGEYMLYKEHELVIDYLVQNAYRSYVSHASESSGFLALKYAFYFFILLFTL